MIDAEHRWVLVVDDDEAICELIADVLADEGVAVRCARSDREAYDALRISPAPSGLVLDINLGEGHTGFDIARAARSSDPAIDVLFVTGEADERSVRTHGVTPNRFLFKPFTANELREAFGLGRYDASKAGEGDGEGYGA